VIEEVNLDDNSKGRELNEMERRNRFEPMNDAEAPKSGE
jgi:hypothetical protein